MDLFNYARPEGSKCFRQMKSSVVARTRPAALEYDSFRLWRGCVAESPQFGFSPRSLSGLGR